MLGWRSEHHIKKILAIRELILRIHKGLANIIFIAPCRDGGHFGEQSIGRNFPMTRVVDIQRIVIKRRQRAHHTHHHRHRMRVTTETAVKIIDLLMQHGVIAHRAEKLFLLRGIRQIAVQQQITGLKKIGILGQLLDRVASVVQQTALTVDEGNTRITTGSR